MAPPRTPLPSTCDTDQEQVRDLLDLRHHVDGEPLPVLPEVPQAPPGLIDGFGGVAPHLRGQPGSERRVLLIGVVHRTRARRTLAGVLTGLARPGTVLLMWCFSATPNRAPWFSLKGPSRLGGLGIPPEKISELFGPDWAITALLTADPSELTALYWMTRHQPRNQEACRPDDRQHHDRRGRHVQPHPALPSGDRRCRIASG